jgi:hypothetical protein
VIVRWFKKCFISNAVNGRENDILWEYEEEVENVGSGSDEAGNGDSEGGEVGNNDSEGSLGNCEASQKN